MPDTPLKQVLKQKIEAFRPRIQKLNKDHAEVVIDKVTIGQVIGGARDVHALVTDISYLDPQEGIRFRGMTIPETFAALPKFPGAEQPIVEGFFYFLLTGEIPTVEQAQSVAADWRSRATLPPYVKDVLRAMPPSAHPMALFSTGVLSMEPESILLSAPHRGDPQEERDVGPDLRGRHESPGAPADPGRPHLPDEVQGRQPHRALERPRLGR